MDKIGMLHDLTATFCIAFSESFNSTVYPPVDLTNVMHALSMNVYTKSAIQVQNNLIRALIFFGTGLLA